MPICKIIVPITLSAKQGKEYGHAIAKVARERNREKRLHMATNLIQLITADIRESKEALRAKPPAP